MTFFLLSSSTFVTTLLAGLLLGTYVRSTSKTSLILPTLLSNIVWAVAVGLWRNANPQAFVAQYGIVFNFALPFVLGMPGALAALIILTIRRARLTRRADRAT
jgi:hypothetical protein